MSEAPNKPRTYVQKCTAREIVFNGGGSNLKLGFHSETLIAFIREHSNAKGYINLVVAKRLKPGQFGDTHSIYLDTWKPNFDEAKAAVDRVPSPQPRPARQETAGPVGPDDDVPF